MLLFLEGSLIELIKLFPELFIELVKGEVPVLFNINGQDTRSLAIGMRMSNLYDLEKSKPKSKRRKIKTRHIFIRCLVF